jgi:hypothetical protein
MKLRWISFMSSRNPETGEVFMLPSRYKKLQYWDVDDWKDVEVIDEETGKELEE